ncbi:MAG: ABC transporter ATP-binding protein [Fastidiosipila sp.]|nr:ABC transporter ATP-binding protein [Fastidiosipila sp.]
MSKEKLLDIQDLRVWFKTYRGYSKVLDGVNFHVNQKEKVGLVGESGCGKTTTMKAALRLLEGTSASIREGSKVQFSGQDVLSMDNDELLDYRRNHVSMISQSPMSALNPVFTIGEQMMDVVKYSDRVKSGNTKEMEEVIVEAVNSVMIPDPARIMKSYPHQLSGGMRQRICIATALVKPCELLIADEPGTALDVTVEAQINDILRKLVDEGDSSLVMITHSLGVVRDLVDKIYVMYAGEIVEIAPTKELFHNPRHPYTECLLASVPRLTGGGLSAGIYGYVPDYFDPPSGCRFANRCKYCTDDCLKEKPPMVEVSPGHFVTCIRWQ